MKYFLIVAVVLLMALIGHAQDEDRDDRGGDTVLHYDLANAENMAMRQALSALNLAVPPGKDIVVGLGMGGTNDDVGNAPLAFAVGVAAKITDSITVNVAGVGGTQGPVKPAARAGIRFAW